VVSPLDPDWRADGVAPATGVAMPQENHAVAPVPTSGASYAPPAPAVPAQPSPPAPAAPSPMPAAPVAPMPAAPVADPVSAVSEQSAPATAEHSATARAALEENSDLEAGLLTDLLIEVLDKGASDLHITAGARPTIRLNGTLMQMEERPIMTPPTIQRMLYAVLTQKQREKFEEVLELDFAYAVPGKARFRVNIYRQRDALGAAFRLIPYEIKALEDLGIPPSISNFAMLPRGFVLVTGPTGSGKSTTLASLVDLANRNRRDHIMTVEDPIEFLHRHKSCLVNQREVGEDTWSFQNALKHVLRQDPDIILVGEMRDLETISVALTAAETGHLVFATLHTQDAAQTIDRVIDVFPPHQQQQVRVQLAGALQGVVCQALAKTADGQGRVVATEVLVATPAVRNLIREGKTHQIYSALQAGAKHGMHTMDQHLADLVKTGKITYDTGVEKCHHIEDFNRLCGRG
jgi:twitching motility protein PilT